MNKNTITGIQRLDDIIIISMFCTLIFFMLYFLADNMSAGIPAGGGYNVTIVNTETGKTDDYIGVSFSRKGDSIIIRDNHKKITHPIEKNKITITETTKK